MELFDLLNLKEPNINPTECKIHLAVWNGINNPIDVFLSGEFEDWQSWQTKRNFERPYIISLIQLSGRNKWLFAGLFQSEESEYIEVKELYKYVTSEVKGIDDLTGRLVVSFERTGRQSYLNAERWHSSIKVEELKAKKIEIEKFKGYKKVLITKSELDIIVTQSSDSWKSALSNVAGVYLITDIKTGKLYVGSATGQLGIWQRWCDYSNNGHGGNKDLSASLKKEGTAYANNFQYSILEIADTHASLEDILQREAHWKRVLCSVNHGYNGA